MAVRSEYPVSGDPIVRGDPLTIPVDITVAGLPQDITNWHWRAHIRRSADAGLITEFTISVTTPPGSTIPSRLLLSLSSEQTRILKTGYVFDLEQLTDAATPETYRTWWIVTKLNVTKDVSHE